MGGKAALLVVVGFGIVLMIFGTSNNDVASKANENFVDHYVSEVAYRIAVSGANIAANRFYVSPAWAPSNEGLDKTSFGDGTLEIQKYDTSASKGRVTIVSTGRYFGKERRVTVVMQATSFGKFVLFINDMGTGGYFPSATVFDGPVHVNVPLKNGVPDQRRRFRLGGTPTFKGKVTSDLMWKAVQNPTNPDFQQGFEDEVHVTLPDEFADALIDATRNGSYDQYGAHEIGFEFTKDRNVSLIFNDNGTITYKEYELSDTSFNTMGKRINPPSDPTQATAEGWITKSFDQLVPAGKKFNGAMLISNGNLRVKGTLDGKVTLGVLDKNNAEAPNMSSRRSKPFRIDPNKYRGNVWFEDDVLYKDDPYTNPSSDDMLGIVSTNYLWAANNHENNTTNLITCGSYFSRYKGAITEDLWTLPNMKVNGNRVDWEYRGGWTEGEAQYTTYGSTRGYDQKYKYDTRLMKDSPPFFPATGALSILSWFEE